MGTVETDLLASCENIHKTYLLGCEGVPALRGVAIDVKQGEFLVVYGTSGGGKTTLLNVLGTIDLPTKGNLHLFGKRITDRTPDAELAHIRCQEIGFVFQSFNLLPTMNALDNVCLPMIISGLESKASIKERAKNLLSSVGLEGRMHHFPRMLSGGEQQRVTIARSLGNNPKMLLLDEPTGDLDTKNTLLVMRILLDLNREKGLTMVMVTHDPYMKQYAHRVLYMRDGRVQNVEFIDPSVREKALENLENSYKNICDGLSEESQSISSELRAPTDYVTFDAQSEMLFEDDDEMQHVVQYLFVT